MNALLSVRNKNEPACQRKKGEGVKHLNHNEMMFCSYSSEVRGETLSSNKFGISTSRAFFFLLDGR